MIMNELCSRIQQYGIIVIAKKTMMFICEPL